MKQSCVAIKTDIPYGATKSEQVSKDMIQSPAVTPSFGHVERALRTGHAVRALVKEVISAVAVAQIVEFPRYLGTDSGSHLFLIDENFDCSQISTKVPSIRMRFHQLRWHDLRISLR